jgi:hypothetical protein
MGQVRKRGGVYWIRYYRDGRRHEESAHTANLKTAGDLLKVREGDIAKGIPVSSQIGRMRFEDTATDIEAEYLVNGRRSIRDLKGRIKKHLAPYFAGRRMSSLTTADVRAYTAERMKAGAAAGTINRELSVLKRMFTLAVKATKLMVRPHIPMLAENNVRTGFFEREAFEAVRLALPADLPSDRDVRLSHRLAHPERDPVAAMAAARPEGRDRAARPGDDEEPGRAAVPVRRSSPRTVRAPGGAATRHDGHGDDARPDLPVGLPSGRSARQELPGRLGGGLHGGGLSGDDPA